MSGIGRIGKPVPQMPAAAPVQPTAAPEPEAAAVEPPSAPQPQASAEALPDWVIRYEDVLDLPAHLLGHQPLATTLRCQVFGVDFVVTTSRKAYEQARADRIAAFTGAELDALAYAAAEERAWPATLYGWVERKRREPSWRLTKTEACGDYHPPRHMASKHANWTIGRVFARLGVSLLGVGMEG